MANQILTTHNGTYMVVIERDVNIHNKQIVLSGTLCLPEGLPLCPVVLMVHGSGPLDRNENTKGVKLEVFSAIASHLAKHNIASLRYDKRGCGRSTGVYVSAGHHDLVEDANACVEFLKTQNSIDSHNIYVLGHSEGSIIAPQLSPLQPNLAGIILLAPFIKNLRDMLLTQAHNIECSMLGLKGIKGIIVRLLLRTTLFNPVKMQSIVLERLNASDKAVIRFRLKKLNAKWLREMFQLDPPLIYRVVKCPTLIIGGAKDIQCDPSDVDLIRQTLKTPCEAHVLPDLTHILRFDKNEASIFSYKKLIKKPVENDVLNIISKWLLSQDGI